MIRTAPTEATRRIARAAPAGRAHAVRWSEPLLLAALVVVALVAHGLNMLNTPGFTGLGDEGIYMSQAWAVLRQGRLAPYTYFYDHAPAGWILLGAWMGLTGGPHTFGMAIDGGRVLMLLLHLAMVPLLYRVTRKLGAGATAAALAALLFSISPLAVYYQRLVLLDNIMLFWALLSLDLLLDGWGRLSRLVLSGICFGIAVLSKETAIFLLPGFLYLAWQQRQQHQGRFGIPGWLLPMGMVMSLYPLFALLKNELLPAGYSFVFFAFNIGGGEHVSLIEALSWQATRGGGGMFNFDNQFWRYVRTDWLVRDPLLFVGGALATFVNLLIGIRDRRRLAAALLSLLPLYYLGRGGVVLVFYVLAVIPFFCLNLALLVDPLIERLPRRGRGLAGAGVAAALVGGYLWAGTLQPLYTTNPGQAARESILWVKRHVPADSKMVIHDDPWTDLHEPGLGGPAFPNAHNHWKVALDPAIRNGVFFDDWRTVDYVFTLPGIEGIFEETGNTVTIEALANASLVRRWEADGEVVELWKVNQPGRTEQMLLAQGTAAIAGRFERDGAFPDAEGRVTSEAQSYAMLRAVWLGDRPAFDRAWGWTEANMLRPDGLPAWLWVDGAVADANSASDASSDIALALLMAGRRWGDAALVEAGTEMARAIWEHEVTIVQERPYLSAGTWATQGDIVALNPSYFAPYAYRIFAEAVPEHDWYGLIDTSYDVLFESSAASFGSEQSSGLPPDWVGLERASGRLVELPLEGKPTTGYGFDAARAFWRAGLDLRWSDDGRAAAFLEQAGFLRDEVERKGTVSAMYARDGSVVEELPSVVGEAGALSALLQLEPELGHRLHATMLGQVWRDERGPAWGDARDLYAQEWGWFATALYADALPNLWYDGQAR